MVKSEKRIASQIFVQNVNSVEITLNYVKTVNSAFIPQPGL